MNTTSSPVSASDVQTVSGSDPITISEAVSQTDPATATVSKQITATARHLRTVSKVVTVTRSEEQSSNIVKFDDARAYLGLTRSDLTIPGLIVFCNNVSGLNSASIKLSELAADNSLKYLYLYEDGSQTHSIKLSGIPSLQSLVNKIKGYDGWTAHLEGPAQGDPTDLEHLDEVSCLSYTSRVTLDYYNKRTLQHVVDAATGVIESYCQRNFVKRSYTDVYDGNDEEFLILDNYPLVSVASVAIDDSGLDADDWEMYADEGMVYYESDFSKDQRNVDIKYTAGYARSSLPAGLIEICYEIISFCWGRAKRDINMQRETFGRYTYYAQQGFTEDMKERLSQYRSYMVDGNIAT